MAACLLCRTFGLIIIIPPCELRVYSYLCVCVHLFLVNAQRMAKESKYIFGVKKNNKWLGYFLIVRWIVRPNQMTQVINRFHLNRRRLASNNRMDFLCVCGVCMHAYASKLCTHSRTHKSTSFCVFVRKYADKLRHTHTQKKMPTMKNAWDL